MTQRKRWLQVLILCLICSLSGCAWMIPKDFGQNLVIGLALSPLEDFLVVSVVARYHAQKSVWPRSFAEAVGADNFKPEDLHGATITISPADKGGCIIQIRKEWKAGQGEPHLSEHKIRLARVGETGNKYHGEYLPGSNPFDSVLEGMDTRGVIANIDIDVNVGKDNALQSAHFCASVEDKGKK